MNKFKMSNIMNQQIFYIPKPLKSAREQSKYKSPNASPISLHKIQSKENFYPDQSKLELKTRKLKKISSQSITKRNPLEVLPKSCKNSTSNKKLHCNLTEPNRNIIQKKLENIVFKHRNLKEVIRIRESGINDIAMENRKKIIEEINQVDLEIETLLHNRQSLLENQNNLQNSDISIFLSENEDLVNSIPVLRSQILYYGSNYIPPEDYINFKERLSQLEESSSFLADTNNELNQKLLGQIKSNSVSPYCIELKYHLDMLTGINFQLAKISQIIFDSLQIKPLNLGSFLDCNLLSSDKSVTELISSIKKKISNLRHSAADKYAESISSNCETQ